MESIAQLSKEAAGRAAAALVEEGMVVGLGTGSTAACFIESLIERFRNGLKFAAVATSLKSERQAREGGIPILDVNTLTYLDLAVDGADEIDPHKQMIKGGGGALLREKIIATMSREMVVVIDEHKLVKNLGAFPLPVEVAAFACQATMHRIHQKGYAGNFRRLPNGNYYITDNGNYILDITFTEKPISPLKDHESIRSIVGVIETGFFLNMAGRVIMGHADGSVKIW